MREATLDAAFPGRRSIDVGVDNAKKLHGDYMPFDEEWLHEWLFASRGSHEQRLPAVQFLTSRHQLRQRGMNCLK